MKVVIIGAGVAGLGIGWKLAQAGVSVSILERANVGSGATTASAGMIAAAAELGDSDSSEAAFARRANMLWPDFAAEMEAKSDVPVNYHESGSLMVALLPTKNMHESPHGGHRAKPGMPNPHAQGADISLLDAVQARAMEPMLAEGIAGALWAPHEATIDTHAVVRALATAFLRAGGKILPNETAIRFEIENGRVNGVRTPFTLHRADAYVLATGAWTAQLEGLPREAVPPVVPVKGEIVVLAPPPGAVLPKRVVWGNDIYIVPRGNRLLVGATTELAGYDTSRSPEAFRWLSRQSAGLMPALEGWDVAEHWSSLRPGSPDGLPIIGRTLVDGLYVASGQYRNGILFAPAVAEVMSRLILERAVDVPAFDPRRFDGATARAASKSFIETAHRAPGRDAGVREWHAGF
ncbi:MAG: glycine oxidase ThiO [Alphaproteobacteria bacterium]|nr:glycine oxidase ThiO [Alphaproteobacteria bacterium]MDE2495048.1 glycine oxidase ThiO [Alphaproteobacteria bacterium]